MMLSGGFYSICDLWGHSYSIDDVCMRSDCGHTMIERERVVRREEADEHDVRLIALRGIN